MSHGRISDLVRNIKERVKLEDLAPALGIATLRKGGSLRALCPFHDDNDPSLAFYDEPGNRHFHCFACQETGDAIRLTQRQTGLPFTQAVQWLARTYGLQTFSTTSQKQRGSFADEVEYRQGLDVALQAYRESPAADVVSTWTASRGLRPETASAAELGFAATLRLSLFLDRQGVDDDQRRVEEGLLEDAGLLRVARRGAPTAIRDLAGTAYTEFFRDRRVVFPVRNRGGLLIGLAGRQIDLDAHQTSPKYLYTKNMPKGDVLYRSDIVETRIRAPKSAKIPEHVDLYVCEGLVDTLRLEENGLLVVGLLGASASAKQVQILSDWAERVGAKVSFKCHIFLDRDSAGARGAAKLANSLAIAGIGCDIVWPTDEELRSAGIAETDWKDPDAIVRSLQGRNIPQQLSAWTHPAALAVVAGELGALPEVLLVEQTWELISASRKHRSFSKLLRKSATAVDILLDDVGLVAKNTESPWYLELTAARNAEAVPRQVRSDFFLEDSEARLNLARALAQSGASRGELPVDESSWRRIDIAATAFNQGLKARLARPQYGPLEPFDAVFVSRGFGKKEHRLKAMPCPEDLVAQQYVLGELLTERYDGLDAVSFSDCIPAVRYYRSEKRIETTAGGNTFGRDNLTVSFAYQIDMEVVEGLRPASDQGMFRPYIECWRDFILYLKREAIEMPTVHALRLDLKRFYDRLLRTNIRNMLRKCAQTAFEHLEDPQIWAPLLLPDEQNRDDKVVDWLCDQSFGYKYYDPRDGRIASSPPDIGVPQGPVLSAWLANIALFPLDAAMSRAVQELNGEGKRASYARYVDDVFLVGDSAHIVSVLRAVAEETVKSLSLVLVQKGEHYPPMSAQQFGEMLVEGRVAAVSGPAVEPPVLYLGDGVTGNLTWADADLTRASALNLLSDRRNFTMGEEQLRDQLFTALQAKDLRPSELTKVARWIWYLIGKRRLKSAKEAWRTYWETWSSLTRHCRWRLNPIDQPWDDVALLALEGLDVMFSTAHAYERSLDAVEKKAREDNTRSLAELVLGERFLEESTSLPGAPLGVGAAAGRLPRMFIQRLCGVRWKAFHLSRKRAHAPLWTVSQYAGNALLWSSLARARMSECEATSVPMLAMADLGSDPDVTGPLRDALLWMHEAVVALTGASEGSHDEDPLLQLSGRLPELDPRVEEKDTSYSIAFNRFLQIIHLWSADKSPVTLNGTDTGTRTAALLSFVSVCPTNRVVRLLGRRAALLGNALARARPLSPPPGIGVDSVIFTNDEEQEGQAARVGTLRKLHVLSVSSQPDSSAVRLEPVELTGHDACDLMLQWSHVQIAKMPNMWLFASQAEWPSTANLIMAHPPAGREKVDAAALKWAAAAYEAMALVNAKNTLSNSITGYSEPAEYLLAWPYVAFARSSNDANEPSVSTIALFGPKVPSSKLGTSAFVRDGQDSLRSIPVPIVDAWAWRIGYALTDLLGYAEELDRYSALGDEKGADGDGFNPAEHLLRSVLRRLRGELLLSANLPRHKEYKHLPATVVRSLDLLKRFPDGANDSAALGYLLCVETQTRAMEARLASTWMDSPGLAAHFVATVSRKVAEKLPASWREPLAATAAVVWEPASQQERRTVAAWKWWADLAGLLVAQATQQEPAAEGLEEAGRYLCSGLRIAAINAWLRALSLELEFDGRHKLPESVEIPAHWNSDELALTDDADITVKEAFASVVQKGERTAEQLNIITPIGWLVLLVNQLGMYRQDIPCAIMQRGDVAERLDRLAMALTLGDVALDEPDVPWPFEYSTSQERHFLNQQVWESFHATLASVEEEVKFTIQRVVADWWSYQAKSGLFKDASSVEWRCPAWVIDQFPFERRVEEIDGGRSVKKIWTETRNSTGDLIGVSALGLGFSRFLVAPAESFDIIPSAQIEAAELIDRVARGSPAKPADTEACMPSARSADEVLENPPEPPNASEPLARGDVGPPQQLSPDIASIRGASSLTKQIEPSAEEPARTFRLWRELQSSSWRRRSGRASNHIRAAFVQFRIDDSYEHPLLEVGIPTALKSFLTEPRKAPPALGQGATTREDHGSQFIESNGSLLERAKKALAGNGSEVQWVFSAQLPSWAEHRRRKLLEVVLDACNSFTVDILVLPEYSIRPDTVAWLQDQLLTRGVTTSVLAGSYRLHGKPSDVHFKELHSKILGDADKEVLTGSNATNLMGLEKSAVMTLLHPLSSRHFADDVMIFSRRKKYASIAMGELVNPGTDSWAPLFTHSALLTQLRTRLEELGVQGAVDATLALVKARPAVAYAAELICSELFLVTSPANWNSVTHEYAHARRRFGHGEGGTSVREDLEKLAEYFGYGNVEDQQTIGNSERRSLLLVPACTSRSADYWIYGQAALLAAGMTTVFCAAVGDRLSGGSCFVGRNSWDGLDNGGPGRPIDTVYGGWSRGIHYNHHSSPLSKAEQAMVIADVDPVYMNEGKPRPQALPVPLRLVAHLPIVETLRASETARQLADAGLADSSGSPQTSCARLGLHEATPVLQLASSLLMTLGAAPTAGPINPAFSEGGSPSLYQLAHELGKFTSDERSVCERADAWSLNWRQRPVYGEPPAAVDWLWADLTPSKGLPLIFVPPWTEATQAGAPDSLEPCERNDGSQTGLPERSGSEQRPTNPSVFGQGDGVNS